MNVTESAVALHGGCEIFPVFSRAKATRDQLDGVAHGVEELKETVAVHSEALFDLRAMLLDLLEGFEDDGET